jgi:hypothetical protein
MAGADFAGSEMGVIEFGAFDEPAFGQTAATFADDTDVEDTVLEHHSLEESIVGSRAGDSSIVEAADRAVAGDPWHGPEVELVFDPYADPFEEYFEQEERVVERFVMRGPDDFSSHRHVASREGLSMARQLDAFEQSHPLPVRPIAVAMATAEPVAEVGVIEDAEAQTDGELDADMVVIEEDLVDHPADIHKKSIFAVRPGDYRSLFARLRRGDK